MNHEGAKGHDGAIRLRRLGSGLKIGARSDWLMSMGVPRRKRQWLVGLVATGLVAAVILVLLLTKEMRTPPPIKITLVHPYLEEIQVGGEKRHMVPIDLENLSAYKGSDEWWLYIWTKPPKLDDVLRWKLEHHGDMVLRSGGNVVVRPWRVSVDSVSCQNGTGRIEADFMPGGAPKCLVIDVLRRGSSIADLAAWAKRQYETLFIDKRFKLERWRRIKMGVYQIFSPDFPTNVVAEPSKP